MERLYIFFAFGIAVIHLIVAFYLLSLLMVFFKKQVPLWYVKIYAGILGIAGLCHFTTGVCPLTFGENYLRSLAGGKRYSGNFLNHYAEKLFQISIPNQLVSNSIILLAMLFSIMLFQAIFIKKGIDLKMLSGKK